jgi:putative membrane protein
MHRRVVLAGLAATTVAVPVLAQTSGPSSTTQPGQTGSAAPGGMGHTDQPSQADMQYMQDTLRVGTVALEASKIALEKARHADLKQFARFETDEQTTLGDVLRSMMEPAATSATGSMAGNNPPMQMDAKERDMIEKLRNARAGATFDREYYQGQVEGHHELLQIQDRYLQSNPQNRESMNVAKMARGMIREHITLLDDMKHKIR